MILRAQKNHPLRDDFWEFKIIPRRDDFFEESSLGGMIILPKSSFGISSEQLDKMSKYDELKFRRVPHD